MVRWTPFNERWFEFSDAPQPEYPDGVRIDPRQRFTFIDLTADFVMPLPTFRHARARARLAHAAVFVLAAAAGCGRPPAGGTPVPGISTPAAPTRSAAEIADSIQRAAVGRFMHDFQTASTPMLKAGNYLGIVQLLARLQAQAPTNRDVQWTARQLVGTYASFVGQSQEALEAFAFETPAPVPFDSAALGRLAPEDAVDAVTRLASTRQAVFINEAHHMPRDRAFVANLLPKLRALGFSYLAVETLADDDTAINTRRYPVHASGFYSNEPVFGDMLRTALKLGFRLVPYEASSAASTTQDARESGQARHLVDRILARDPHARIVVYAGYDHINESGTLGGAPPMAVRFRELTGIDPLTVDQTTLTEQADTTYEDSRYRFLMRRVRRQAPFVLRNRDSTVWSARPGVHDVTVIHPRAVNRAFRPNWLWALGGRRAYLLSDEVCANALDCVVSARLADESDDAVPVDVLRIQFSAPGSKTFALPPGRYVIEARDGSGAVLTRQTVTTK